MEERGEALRDARLEDLDQITDLHRRSALVWESTREVLSANPGVFGVAPESVRAGLVRVLARGEELIAYALMSSPADGACELAGLFVDPDSIGRGIGRLLVEDAAARARAQGAGRLDVTANPEALGFYERLGFAELGPAETQFGPAVRMAFELD